MFPRVVRWDGDSRKDLLVGQADGRLRLYTNTNTDEAPEFDGGVMLQVGAPGSKVDIDVGERATPVVVDWNNDGKKDIVVGDKLGGVRVFVNEGTDDAPDFLTSEFLQNNGSDIVVYGTRASPHVDDFDGDGRKDLLTGNTNGQVLFYSNTGTDESPSFSGYELVTAAGVVIDLVASRSRVFACDWTGDGSTDVLVGASDGLVRLYQGTEHMVGISGDAVASPAVRLGAAHPNPFNPRVDIPVEIPVGGRVRVSIFTPGGRRVAVLLDEDRRAGRHVLTWYGKDRHGEDVPSGVYFVRLESSTGSDASKLVLLR